MEAFNFDYYIYTYYNILYCGLERSTTKNTHIYNNFLHLDYREKKVILSVCFFFFFSC